MTDLLKTTSPENQALIASHAGRRDMARELGNTLGEQLETAHNEWQRALGVLDGLNRAMDAIERHMLHWAKPDKGLSEDVIGQRRTATDFALETLSDLKQAASIEHYRSKGARTALEMAFNKFEREHALEGDRLAAVMKAVVAERDNPPAPVAKKPRRKAGTHPGEGLAAKRRDKANG